MVLWVDSIAECEMLKRIAEVRAEDEYIGNVVAIKKL